MKTIMYIEFDAPKGARSKASIFPKQEKVKSYDMRRIFYNGLNLTVSLFCFLWFLFFTFRSSTCVKPTQAARLWFEISGFISFSRVSSLALGLYVDDSVCQLLNLLFQGILIGLLLPSCTQRHKHEKTRPKNSLRLGYQGKHIPFNRVSGNPLSC